MNTNKYTPISAMFQDARLRAAFQRIERDSGSALVLPRQPDPVLSGGAVTEVA